MSFLFAVVFLFRYANRARNIKNKPVVNRDPTLVMIDELKNLLRVRPVYFLLLRKMFTIHMYYYFLLLIFKIYRVSDNGDGIV
jgi:hypothetical protein